MRATSPPAAPTVAAAALALSVAVLMPLADPSTALGERWLRPVPGEVARSFDYDSAMPFTGGAHRGADLAARPGAPVRAACGGRVIHAGRVAGSERVVSVRCGSRRVSYLPLATVRVREGATVDRGAALGTVAAGHGGLHVGVRRERDRFAYEDPLRLFTGTEAHPPPIAAPARRSPRLAHPRRAPSAPPRRAAPVPRAVALPSSVTPPAAAPGRRVPAPWPVWLGLALVLGGAAGGGTLVLRRRRGDRPAVVALVARR